MNIRIKKNQRQKNQGQAVMVAAIFFLLISMIFILGATAPILTEAKITNDLILSDQSYYTAESGVEDDIYRLKANLPVPLSDSLTVASSTAAITMDSVSGGKQIVAVGDQSNLYRTITAAVSNSVGISFDYGVQAGVGGLNGNNEPIVEGSVYSNATVTGVIDIYGDAISAGSSSGLLGSYFTSLNIFGNARAHSINDATVDGDAYFGCDDDASCSSDSVIFGASHPNSADPSIIPMPVSDSLIAGWESEAAAGTVQNCTGTYELDTNTTGPEDITCNVHIGAGDDVSIAGPLWIQGSLTIDGSAVVRVDSSAGAYSIPVVADDPSDHSSGSTISINGATFYNSGTDGSYVVLVSMNNSAQLGGGESAISEDGGAGGSVALYAPHGQVSLTGGSNAQAVAGYTVGLYDGATIYYENGLGDITFPPTQSSAISTTYTISKWQETE